MMKTIIILLYLFLYPHDTLARGQVRTEFIPNIMIRGVRGVGCRIDVEIRIRSTIRGHKHELLDFITYYDLCLLDHVQEMMREENYTDK